MLAKKRFVLPKGLSCGEMVVRELSGKDDLTAAQRADAKLSADEKLNPIVSMQVQRREAMRLSLVEVDGRKVNLGEPFMNLDDWSQRTVVFLSRAFEELNGVKEDELKNFLAGATDEEATSSSAKPATAERDDD